MDISFGGYMTVQIQKDQLDELADKFQALFRSVDHWYSNVADLIWRIPGTDWNQRRGGPGLMAQLLLTIPEESADFPVGVTLEDLGFFETDKGSVTMEAIFDRAHGLGLKKCPIGIVAAAIQVQPQIRPGTRTILMTDSIEKHRDKRVFALRRVPQDKALIVEDVYAAGMLSEITRDGLFWAGKTYSDGRVYEVSNMLTSTFPMRFVFMAPPGHALLIRPAQELLITA